MPTANATRLVAAHQRDLRRLQTDTAREFARLWPDADWVRIEAIFDRWADAAARVAQRRRVEATRLGTEFVTAYRELVGVDTGKLATAEQVPVEVLKVNLQATVRDSLRAAAVEAAKRPDEPGTRGRILAEGRKAALTRGIGAMTRQVANGARETVLASAAANPRTTGWARISDGDPCGFCAMLLSRGAVYTSGANAGFTAHDGCGCTAVEVFGRDWPGREQHEHYDQLWRQVTAGKRGKEALNSFRQAVGR